MSFEIANAPYVNVADVFTNGIVTGLTTIVPSSSLTGQLEGGIAFVNGQRIVFQGSSYSVAASSTSYLDLNMYGGLNISTSSTPSSTSLRLWEIVSGTEISSVTQIAGVVGAALGPISQSGVSGQGNQTPLLNVGDAFSDFIASGMQWNVPSSASLTTGMSSGVAYINGVRTLVPAVSGNNFPASNDTYVSVNNSGLIDYQSVANGATAPTPTSGYVQTVKVVTSPIQSPTATLSTSTSGSLASGTYGIALVAFDATGYGAVGASGTVAVTSAQSGSGSIEISWVNPLNETSMDIYATTAGGTTLGLVASGVTGTSYTYTGSVAPGAAAPTVATSNAIQITDSLLPIGGGYQPRFSGSKKRSIIGRLSQEASILDFDVDPTGNNDSTSGFQQAINEVQDSVIALKLTAGVFSVDELTVTGALKMEGVGSGYNQSGLVPVGNSIGTVLWIQSTGIGINYTGASFNYGNRLKGFATYRNQPAPSTPGWAPANLGADILMNAQNDFYIEDLFLINPTNGINIGGTGRININRLRANPFATGIVVENTYDVCIFRNTHFWPFWNPNISALQEYTVSNADMVQLYNCSNPQLDNIFTIAARSGIRFSQNSNGCTKKLHISNGDFDSGGTAIWIDDTVTDGVTAQFENITSQGYGSGINNPFLQIDGDKSSLQFGSAAPTYYQLAYINITGNNNTLSIDNFSTTSGNMSNTSGTLPINNTGSGNAIYLGNSPIMSYKGGPANGTTSAYWGSGVQSIKQYLGSFNGYTASVGSGTLSFSAYGQAIQPNSGAKITLPIEPLSGGQLLFYPSSNNNYSIIANSNQFIFCPSIGLSSSTGGTVLNVTNGDTAVLLCRGNEFDVVGGTILLAQNTSPSFSENLNVPAIAPGNNNTLNGTTSGYIYYTMPVQGISKEVVLYCYEYENGSSTAQTITFPIAFGNTPYIAENGTGMNVSVSTTGISFPSGMSAAATTGYIVIKGI